VRPRTLDGDWNTLYADFPEVYDEFASIAHRPRPVDVIADRFPLDGKDVIDVGAGSGRSTIELAERARHVVGVEPNPSMLAVARQRAAEAHIVNLELLQGDAAAIPCDDESADVIACLTTVFWPPETIIPTFVAEAQRVLRDGGLLISVNTRPGWYGGELREFVNGNADEYEQAVSRAFDAAGMHTFDFESLQEYETTERAVATFGFIFGGRSIEHLEATRQTTIAWQWRAWYIRKTDLPGASAASGPSAAPVFGNVP
jgi:ubiquinone/menaquinone biosynthesis C-methylase UbiE